MDTQNQNFKCSICKKLLEKGVKCSPIPFGDCDVCEKTPSYRVNLKAAFLGILYDNKEETCTQSTNL